VFNNLISNAVDAVRQSENPRIVLTVIKTDSLLQVNVTDNGHGISVDEQKMIFEPRFTTKGSGTGLGLTIAQSIIDQLGGKLEVDSDFSAGAQFRVLFQRK
jgi:C4-dicarboxylate-specific signal transduction histidine kinase